MRSFLSVIIVVAVVLAGCSDGRPPSTDPKSLSTTGPPSPDGESNSNTSVFRQSFDLTIGPEPHWLPYHNRNPNCIRINPEPWLKIHHLSATLNWSSQPLGGQSFYLMFSGDAGRLRNASQPGPPPHHVEMFELPEHTDDDFFYTVGAYWDSLETLPIDQSMKLDLEFTYEGNAPSASEIYCGVMPEP
jgi:hypothetical protein